MSQDRKYNQSWNAPRPIKLVEGKQLLQYNKIKIVINGKSRIYKLTESFSRPFLYLFIYIFIYSFILTFNLNKISTVTPILKPKQAQVQMSERIIGQVLSNTLVQHKHVFSGSFTNQKVQKSQKQETHKFNQTTSASGIKIFQLRGHLNSLC